MNLKYSSRTKSKRRIVPVNRGTKTRLDSTLMIVPTVQKKKMSIVTREFTASTFSIVSIMVSAY